MSYQTPKTPESQLARFLPLGVIVIVATGGALFFRDYLSFQAFADNREALLAFRDTHYAWAAAGFILAYIVIVAFGLPGATIATLVGGFLFEIFPGALYNVIGASLGAIAIFLAVGWGLGERFAARLDASDGAIKKIKKGIDENQWSMLFLIRLVPAVPFFVANLLSAFFGVSLFRYAVSTFFGIIPGTVVYTFVGAGLGDLLSRGERPNFSVIFSPPVLLPILGLAALSALPMVIKYFRKEGHE